MSPRRGTGSPSVRCETTRALDSTSRPSTSAATAASAATLGLAPPGAGAPTGGTRTPLAFQGLAASAAFLALPALDAQRRPGEGQQPGLAHRLAARLAHPVGPGGDPDQRMLGLLQQLAGVVADRQLVLALVDLAAGVGLVVAGLGHRVPEQARDGRAGLVGLGPQLGRLGLELCLYLGELGH